MTGLVGGILMALGAGFVVVAGIGVVRLPDAFARMHAATKAGTLGATLTLLGAALCLGGGAWLTAGLTILVLLATLPLAAQLLGRAAYVAGTAMTDLAGPDPLAGILPRRTADGPAASESDAMSLERSVRE